MVFVHTVFVTMFLESLLPMPTHKKDFDLDCSETEMSYY